MFIITDLVSLRNLSAHTVHNLQPKINYVFLQYSVIKQKSMLFTSCLKISEHNLGYYAQYSLLNLKVSKSKVTNNVI